MRTLDFTIRQMVEDDLPAVAEIEAGVFTDWNRRHRRDPEPLAQRTHEDLLYTMSFDPQGNLVGIASDGSLVGFIFSRSWGEVGWFGTFGVPTQHQGSGIGRALMGESVAYLREHVRTVGLETMPESGTNLGLYTKGGFAVTHPTILLTLSLLREADRLKGLAAADVNALDPGDSSATGALKEIRGICRALLPGLDYTREIVAVDRHALGETLVSLGDGGRLDGFAVLRTAPFREQDVSGRAYLHVLAVRPGADDQHVLADLLRQVWARATARGFSRVVTGVSGMHQRALELLLRGGFRVVRAALRMVEQTAPPAFFEPSARIDVSRWAG